MSTYIAAGAAILIFIGGYFWFTADQADAPSATDASVVASTTVETGDDGAEATQPPVAQPTTGVAEAPVLSSESNQAIMKVTLKTNMGDITINLNRDGTPKTVENFVTLAQKGFYDGTKFHRVIAGFMNQGGDPLSKDDTQMMRWGTGGPGYTFADEITASNNNLTGTLSMANAGPNTNGSQFFINVADNTFLNPKHTVFGTVVAGMDVVTKINQVKTGPNDRPIEPVVIQSIVLE